MSQEEPPEGQPHPCWRLCPPGALRWGWWAWEQVMGHPHARCPPCQVPVELLLLLTVPVVDPDKDDLNWRRPLNCLHILTSPLLCVLTLKSGACKSLGSPSFQKGTGLRWPSKPWGLQSLPELAPHCGEEGWAGKSQAVFAAGLQLDTPSQGWGAWVPQHPGPEGKMAQAWPAWETEARRGAAL